MPGSRRWSGSSRTPTAIGSSSSTTAPARSSARRWSRPWPRPLRRTARPSRSCRSPRPSSGSTASWSRDRRPVRARRRADAPGRPPGRPARRPTRASRPARPRRGPTRPPCWRPVESRSMSFPAMPSNLKVTVPADLARATALLAGADATRRTGIGHDSHPFGPGRRRSCWAASRSPGAPRLHGHSDGDVVAARRRRRAARGGRARRSRPPVPGRRARRRRASPARELLADVRGRLARRGLAPGRRRPDDRRAPARGSGVTSTRCAAAIAELARSRRRAPSTSRPRPATSTAPTAPVGRSRPRARTIESRRSTTSGSTTR